MSGTAKDLQDNGPPGNCAEAGFEGGGTLSLLLTLVLEAGLLFQKP